MGYLEVGEMKTIIFRILILKFVTLQNECIFKNMLQLPYSSVPLACQYSFPTYN